VCERSCVCAHREETKEMEQTRGISRVFRGNVMVRS
jgi:hypothetical protein